MAYTIAAVADRTKPWNAQSGPMLSYWVDMKDSAGLVTQNVELSQKADSPAPTVGQQVEGNIDQGQYGLKFKKAFAAGGGRGGAPKSPEERRAIAASVALREGREAVEQAATMGLLKVASVEEHAAAWKRYAEFAYKFIDSKAKA